MRAGIRGRRTGVGMRRSMLTDMGKWRWKARWDGMGKLIPDRVGEMMISCDDYEHILYDTIL
jgi:hypothetical protein